MVLGWKKRGGVYAGGTVAGKDGWSEDSVEEPRQKKERVRGVLRTSEWSTVSRNSESEHNWLWWCRFDIACISGCVAVVVIEGMN